MQIHAGCSLHTSLSHSNLSTYSMHDFVQVTQNKNFLHPVTVHYSIMHTAQ